MTRLSGSAWRWCRRGGNDRTFPLPARSAATSISFDEGGKFARDHLRSRGWCAVLGQFLCPLVGFEADQSEVGAEEKGAFYQIAIGAEQGKGLLLVECGKLFGQALFAVIHARGVEETPDVAVVIPEHSGQLSGGRRGFADGNFLEGNAVVAQPSSGVATSAATRISVNTDRSGFAHGENG